jgi:endonuclease YncB( thermonuclease family)
MKAALFIFVIPVALASITGPAAADLTGKVIGVSDGDTLTVLVSNRPVKVRISDIDAPESKQPFGTRSRQHLASICHGKPAWVIDKGRDRYKRTLGQVSCAGVDAASAQVRAGMAWVFTKYAAANSPLYELEKKAREGRMGLWSDPYARAPWEWRQARR